MFVEFNTAHIADKSRLYPGVKELLETLLADGLRMAVISNKQETLSRLILKSLGISSCFDVICGGDTFPEMKPSPMPLIKVMDGFGVTPAQAVMVGDSINDIQAGNRPASQPSAAPGAMPARGNWRRPTGWQALAVR